MDDAQNTLPTKSDTDPAQQAVRAWRAYWFGIANGVLFNIGTAFVDPFTVLPTLVASLTPSKIAVGLVSGIGNSGWYLPQLLTAGYLQSKPLKRPVYVAGAIGRTVSLLALIPCVHLLGVNSGAALIAFFILYGLYSIAGGLSGPAFLDIVAKTVPTVKLGSFFGHRMFWGGIGGIGAGLLVRYILGSRALSFPDEYTLLFIVASVVFLPGWIVFTLVHEPPGRVPAVAQPLLRFLLKSPSTVRANPRFRLLLASSLLSGSVGIAMPFYIVYARQVLEVPVGTVGTYIAVQMAGSVVLVPLWAYLNDRRGPRTLLLAVNATCLFATAIALGATLLPGATVLGRAALMLVFFPLTAVGSGTFMGYTRYLFGIAPEEQRTLYIGIHNTMFAFTTFLPLLGGVILDASSFQVLFTVAVGLAVGTLLVTVRLPRMAPGDESAEA